MLPHSPLTQDLSEYRLRAGMPPAAAELPVELAARVMRYGAPVGCLIEEHERLPRCMDRLRELIAAPAPGGGSLPSGSIVIARELVKGCGRFAREWHAPAGGLWLALAWADTLLPASARLLPLAVGTACCEAVRAFGVPAALKWVNDLHCQGRKLGGILCETVVGGMGGDRYHLLGIGINVNNTLFPGPLRSTAVSMRDILGAELPLQDFTVTLLASLSWHLGLVHLQEELDLAVALDQDDAPPDSLVAAAWRRFSDTPGRQVLYGYDVVRQPLYPAVAEGIDGWGGLMLRLPSGELLTEYSGEILYQGAD